MGSAMVSVGMERAAPSAGAIEVTGFPIAVEASFPRGPAPESDGAVWQPHPRLHHLSPMAARRCPGPSMGGPGLWIFFPGLLM